MQQRTPFKLSCANFFFLKRTANAMKGAFHLTRQLVVTHTHGLFLFCFFRFLFSEELKITR